MPSFFSSTIRRQLASKQGKYQKGGQKATLGRDDDTRAQIEKGERALKAENKRCLIGVSSPFLLSGEDGRRRLRKEGQCSVLGEKFRHKRKTDSEQSYRKEQLAIFFLFLNDFPRRN